MRVIRKIFTRMSVTVFLVLMQIAAFVLLAGAFVGFHPIVYWSGVFISVLVFSYVLKKDEASVYKITWLIVILAMPPIGGMIYLFFGDKRPIRRIAAHMREHALIAKLLDADGELPFENEIKHGRMYGLIRYIRRASSYHAYAGTDTKYYPTGEPMFEDMLDEINRAERFIFLEFFIIKHGAMWDRLLDALVKKVNEGVDVRLIVDHLGSHSLFTMSHIRSLRALGLKVLRFNPLFPVLLLFMNNRDHRKILVVDGKTAFTGGINIADEYVNLKKRFGVWKDNGIRLRGDGVWSFTLMFIEMWDTFCRKDENISDCEVYRGPPGETAAGDAITGDGFVIPYGDSPLDREQLGENVYVDILTQAERYVYIFTPYLIIGEKLIAALQLAAKRGVDVRIITPGIPDKKLVFRLTRSYYRHMLEAGVRIFEWAPGFMHSKGMVCDDEIAVVGTINFDYRSLYLHFECAVLLYQASVIKDIRDDALAALEQSREVDPKPPKWRLWSDLLDAVLHLFAPLM